MSKKIIAPKDGPPPAGPYSPAVAANGFLFVSGQIPLDPATGEIIQDSFEREARQTLENLKSVVEAGGATLNDVVKVNIYLADIARFGELNQIYSEYFDESKPARACVQAAKLPKDASIEIEAVAVLNES